jgi:hypothetical protein
LPGTLAERLAVRSDSVARHLEAGDDCRARAEAEELRTETIEAINRRRVPPAFQEELLGSVTALVESIECLPPAPPAEPDEEGDDEDDEDEDDEEPEEKKDKKDKNGGKNGKDKD